MELHRASDEMERELQGILQRLTRQLDFQLVSPSHSNKKVHRRRQHFLCLTLPHAVGVCPPHDPVELVAVVKMTAPTFWQYMAETFDVETTFTGDYDVWRMRERTPLRDWDFRIRLLRVPYDCVADPWQPDEYPVQDIENVDALLRIRDTQFVASTLDEFHQELHAAGKTVPRTWEKTSGDDSSRIDLDIEEDSDPPQSSELLTRYLEYCTALLRLTTWAFHCGLTNTSFDLLPTEALVVLFDQAYHRLGHHFTDGALSNETFGNDKMQYLIRQICHQPLVNRGMMGTSLLHIQSPNGRDLTKGNIELTRAFRHAVEKVVARDGDLSIVLPSTFSGGYRSFRADYDVVISLTGHCWTPQKLSTFRDYIIESTLKLQKYIRTSKSGTLGARTWPHVRRLEDNDEALSIELGIYFATSENPQPQTPDLKTYLRRAWNEKWIKGFETLLVHERNEMSLEITRVEHSPVPLPTTTTTTTTTTTAPSSPSSTTTTPSTTKFPTASTAMSRLKWDPKHRSTAYEVGYLDRFDNSLMWKALWEWQKVTEEEDWIPEHRIWKMRRVEDEKVVWDREGRWEGL